MAQIILIQYLNEKPTIQLYFRKYWKKSCLTFKMPASNIISFFSWKELLSAKQAVNILKRQM